MIQHYLKIAVRQLTKHRTQTVISVLGIAAGLLCFSVCSYYCRIMSAGNKSLPTYERMAEIRALENSQATNWQTNIPPNDFYTKIDSTYYEAMAYYINSTARISLEDDLSYRIKQTRCNRDFFKVFPPQCVAGTLRTFDLSQQVAVVTTDFVAKYSGGKYPIGKNLRTEDGKSYTIVAVIQSYQPGMNHYPERYDIFLPLESNFTYGNHKLLLHSPGDAKRLEQRMKQANFFSNKPEWAPCILLDSEAEQRFGAELWIAILGVLVLLTSMINFFSFSIGSFSNRCKELSLRHTMGEKAKGLFAMLFIEQSITILLGMLIAFVATETLLPWVIRSLPNEARGELAIDFGILWRYMGQYLLLLLLLSAAIASLSVWYIRRQTASQNMRGGSATGSRHVVRNTLLGFQFFFSMLFLIGICGIQLQIKTFHTNANPQMSLEEKENIVVLNLRGNQPIQHSLEEFKTFLRSRRWNDKMAYTSSDYIQTDDFIEIVLASDEYFELMKVTKHHRVDEPFCYVNRVLGQQMSNDSTPDRFRYHDLMYPLKGTTAIQPESRSAKSLAILPFDGENKVEKIYLRIAPGTTHKEVMTDLAEEMNKYLPVNEPYEFVTLYDEHIGRAVPVLRGLLVVCSLICLLITILGIYGAISLDTSRRQKEVAIRKINGARLKDIYWIFGRNYLWLFIAASLLSMALSLFILIMGAQSKMILFSYTTPWLWIIPPGIMMAVVVLTINQQIYRISCINPTEIIKNE